MRPVLIHHVHLTLRAEHKRGQVSAFTAKACPNRKPNAVFPSKAARGKARPGVGEVRGGGGGALGWGREQGDVGGGGVGGARAAGGCMVGAVMLLHSCQNWQFSFVFCGFTLGMA